MWDTLIMMLYQAMEFIQMKNNIIWASGQMGNTMVLDIYQKELNNKVFLLGYI